MGPTGMTGVDAAGVDRRIPARLVLATRDGDLPGADLRVYRFHSRHVQIPPLRDIAVIAWQSRTHVTLQCSTVRESAQMGPGDFSILGPGYESTWRWDRAFDATVLFLKLRRLADLASEVFDRHVDTVAIREAFQLRDPVIQHGIATLAVELRRNAIGAALCRQALLNQLCVHLLRHHADIRLQELRCPGALSAEQACRVADYIEGNLAADLSLQSLAGVVGLSRYHFARLFRKRFGAPPHAYVQRRRVERARHFVMHSDMELKDIVDATGFCDQSHLTKVFRTAFGTTPAKLRRTAAAP